MEIEQTRDTVVKKLTSTRGDDLEIMSNLSHPSQINVMMEGLVSKLIGDDVGEEEVYTLLRGTVGYRGRGREDLTGIGKTPDQLPGWRQNDH